MSKEVKRYELRIVDRYAGDGTGDIETDACMKQEARGRYVLFSDYDALLAERDRLREALEAMLEIHGVTQRYAETHIEIPLSWVEVSDLARAAIAKARGES